MGKKKQKKKLSAAEDFEAFYGNLFEGRWENLRKALEAEPRYSTLAAPLIREYHLDEASRIAAEYLMPAPGQSILDMCAAPGGKSLTLLNSLLRESPAAFSVASGTLFIANERSSARRARLIRVLAEHLPAEAAAAVKVTSHDAARWGEHEQDRYDRIFLDVPCSSERHLVQDPRYLRDWSQGRGERLAQQAYSFLISALRALKPGGQLVYATCALNPGENDRVIDRVLTRALKKADMSVMTANSREPALPWWVEASPLGWVVLPDRAEGRGPLYFSRLKKLESASRGSFP